MGLLGNRDQFDRSIADMCKSLCPGALSLHVMRIDTPASHPHKTLYEAEFNYFRIMRKRWLIREARTGEFDYTPSIAPFVENYPNLNLQSVSAPTHLLRKMWKHIPRLWVYVNECNRGTHVVSTIYRGRPMWKTEERDGLLLAKLSSEEELASVMGKIQACEGLDQEAWTKFVQKYWDAAVVDAAVPESKTGIVH